MNATVKSRYCLGCSSRKVVRGSLGESVRFYPLRGFLKAILGTPVFVCDEHAHACADCGLIWNELDVDELRKNIRSFGLAPHSTGVMRIIGGKNGLPNQYLPTNDATHSRK